MKKWDSNWDRLKLETKMNKIRNKINELEIENRMGINMASNSASTALYVANNR